MVDLLSAHRHTTQNWAEIEGSTLCGCCSCERIFPRDEIVAWTGLDVDHIDDPEAVNRQTALCPRCGSEAVIGDKSGCAINSQFLSLMNEAWYQTTVIQRSRPKE